MGVDGRAGRDRAGEDSGIGVTLCGMSCGVECHLPLTHHSPCPLQWDFPVFLSELGNVELDKVLGCVDLSGRVRGILTCWHPCR